MAMCVIGFRMRVCWRLASSRRPDGVSETLECRLTKNNRLCLCAGDAKRYPSLPPPIALDHKDFYVVYPKHTELGLIWKVGHDWMKW